MAKTHFQPSNQIEALQQFSLGVIGYGNQGRAQALNLRDSGLKVHVGSRSEGLARSQALADGFAAESIAQVVANCDVIALLLPDEVLAKIYISDIEPYLPAHPTFVFAHGFAIRHQVIKLPDDADVVLVAPTGPGHQLRQLYLANKGLPALVAVAANYSGDAWPKCLAYAAAIGSGRAGIIETTFEEETVTDLFCEQSVLCGGIPELIKTSFDVLVSAGYQPELAYISCLKEVKLIADLLFEKGLDGMREAISSNAKFGSVVAGPKIINSKSRAAIENTLKQIENGTFAKALVEEHAQGAPLTSAFRAQEKHSKLVRTGEQLSKVLKF